MELRITLVNVSIVISRDCDYLKNGVEKPGLQPKRFLYSERDL